jgi:hypothetical protein
MDLKLGPRSLAGPNLVLSYHSSDGIRQGLMECIESSVALI